MGLCIITRALLANMGIKMALMDNIVFLVCVCGVCSSFPSTHKLAKKIMMTLCHVSSFLGYHQKCTDYLPSFRLYGNIYITAIFLKQKDPTDFLVRYDDGNWNFYFEISEIYPQTFGQLMSFSLPVKGNVEMTISLDVEWTFSVLLLIRFLKVC